MMQIFSFFFFKCRE